MINEVRESPIYRFHGRLLDLSQIWHLYQDADGNVYVNGVCIANYIPYENYIKLEKKFFSYRGHIMTDKQTLKVIKNPFKKAVCILAMKYWRWFQRTIGVNNDTYTGNNR